MVLGVIDLCVNVSGVALNACAPLLPPLAWDPRGGAEAGLPDCAVFLPLGPTARNIFQF